MRTIQRSPTPGELVTVDLEIPVGEEAVALNPQSVQQRKMVRTVQPQMVATGQPQKPAYNAQQLKIIQQFREDQLKKLHRTSGETDLVRALQRQSAPGNITVDLQEPVHGEVVRLSDPLPLRYQTGSTQQRNLVALAQQHQKHGKAKCGEEVTVDLELPVTGEVIPLTHGRNQFDMGKAAEKQKIVQSLSKEPAKCGQEVTVDLELPVSGEVIPLSHGQQSPSTVRNAPQREDILRRLLQILKDTPKQGGDIFVDLELPLTGEIIPLSQIQQKKGLFVPSPQKGHASPDLSHQRQPTVQALQQPSTTGGLTVDLQVPMSGDIITLSQSQPKQQMMRALQQPQNARFAMLQRDSGEVTVDLPVNGKSSGYQQAVVTSQHSSVSANNQHKSVIVAQVPASPTLYRKSVTATQVPASPTLPHKSVITAQVPASPSLQHKSVVRAQVNGGESDTIQSEVKTQLSDSSQYYSTLYGGHQAVITAPVTRETSMNHKTTITAQVNVNSDNDPPSRELTPPPVPPPPPPEALDGILDDSIQQPLYEPQMVKQTTYMNAAPKEHFPPPPEVPVTKRPPGERSVDSLLFELENTASPGPSKPSVQQYNMSQQAGNHYEQIRQVRGPPPPMATQPPGTASTATRELEDLMNSLSEFKVTGNTPHHVGEPPYAQPNKPPRVQNTAPGMMNAQMGTMQDQPLEQMLGNLSNDMSRQGISTVPKGHCAACMKPIVGQVITALGKIWHPEHFRCACCSEELGTQNFYERDSLPYCERDYHNLFSPKCAHCGGPILDKCVTALDKTWHPEHFGCAACGRPFGEDGFHEKDGKAFCRDDYFELFAPKCGGCGRPIMDNYISALSRQWHPECFVCMECRFPFGGGSFFDHEGMPYCETHYHARRGSLCAACQKPITGRCITAMYKKFHPEHFVCAFCLKQLNKGTFKEQNDKPYCHPCFIKLFS